VKCNRSGNMYKVITHSGEEELEIVCKDKGQRSTGFKYNFNFICEDPHKICKKTTSCPHDCHFR
jgi:hypothetical protein